MRKAKAGLPLEPSTCHQSVQAWLAAGTMPRPAATGRPTDRTRFPGARTCCQMCQPLIPCMIAGCPRFYPGSFLDQTVIQPATEPASSATCTASSMFRHSPFNQTGMFRGGSVAEDTKLPADSSPMSRHIRRPSGGHHQQLCCLRPDGSGVSEL